MSDVSRPAARTLKLQLGFRADGPAAGGGGGANRRAAEALRAAFAIVDDPGGADLQVRSFGWEAPERPARLFLDHGSFADASFWAYTLRRLRPGDTIVVTSKVCVQVAARLLRPGSLQILEVPLPIDLECFQPSADRGAVRKEIERAHRVPSAGPLLLGVAAFVRRKNQHLALELLSAVRKTRPDCRLVLVGSVPDRAESRAYREAVEGLAAEAGLGGVVHFLAAVPAPEVARLMAGSDALVHLSTCRLENFGLVAGEAAASGLPVLAADWGGLRDIVRHGVTGFLAPTWLSRRGPRVDWRALVAPARDLFAREEAHRSMSAAARTMAEAQLGLATHAARLRAAVESAAAWSRADAGPVVLTEAGEDLAFRTIALNAAHPEIRDAGDEFRLLLPLEDGRYCRLLIGPAATFERAPRVRREDRLAALVRWRERPEGIEVIDPVWPSTVPLDPIGRRLLQRCDGERPLATILEEIAGAAATEGDRLSLAQFLADEGLVGTGSPVGS